MKKVVIALILVAGLAGGGLWIWSDFQEEPDQPTPAAAAAEAKPIDPAIAEMEARLQASAARAEFGEEIGGQAGRAEPRQSELEKEDNVNVGVVISVKEDGLEVEGKGLKIFRKLFGGDSAGDE